MVDKVASERYSPWKEVEHASAAYWSELWVRDDDPFIQVVALRRRDNGKYYAAARRASVPESEDRGPFDTLAEAIVCADLLIEFGAVPEGW